MTLLRIFALVGVMLGTAVVAPAAHAEGEAITQIFAADSGDSCMLGVTRGTLNWISRGPLAVTTVTVAGTLVDRPLPSDSIACNDPRYSSATFTAYRGDVTVDTEQQRVDNGQITFRFDLTSMSTVYTPIDRVVVQVCRHAPPGIRIPDYCGRAVEYRVITVTP